MQSGGSSGSRREKEPCNWKTCLRKKQVSAYGADGSDGSDRVALLQNTMF
ncbi:MAG: hypothetical protein GX561_13145 [Lentisphaerae bacterium]|nr:hypothetical protein [Lentisphaerota bacterium]